MCDDPTILEGPENKLTCWFMLGSRVVGSPAFSLCTE